MLKVDRRQKMPVTIYVYITQVPQAQLQNGTVAAAVPHAIANATVKSDVITTPSLLKPGNPVLVKADNASSAEPAESKSIEPIRSTR